MLRNNGLYEDDFPSDRNYEDHDHDLYYGSDRYVDGEQSDSHRDQNGSRIERHWSGQDRGRYDDRNRYDQSYSSADKKETSRRYVCDRERYGDQRRESDDYPDRLQTNETTAPSFSLRMMPSRTHSRVGCCNGILS